MLMFIFLLIVLTVGPQVVLSSFKISLADIEQCGPVAITFSGNRPSANDLPLTLAVMPFNSLPIFIPIPNTAVTSPTIRVAFFPLDEGTTFLVSLNDASGDSYGSTSDVMKIQPSSTGNSTCLPAANSTPRRFSVDGPVSQCQPFNVTYDTTLIDRPPSIRAYTPLQSAFTINETGEPTDGIETYLMSASRQTQVALLFDDGFGYQEMSDLLTVGGNSTSDDSCVLARKADSSYMQMNETSSSRQKLSKGAIVGVSVTVGLVVGGMAILVLLYIIRERRRRRRGVRISNFVNTRMVRERPSSTFAGRLVSMPPYISEKSPSVASSQFIYYPGDGARSLADATRYEDWQPDQSNGVGSAGSVTAGLSVDQQSLSSLDIEHILNMATIYSEPPLRPPPVADPAQPMSSLLTVPPLRPRHLRDPSDVPVDLSPHQSLSALFPNNADGISRDSNASYSIGQRLTAASQSSFYSTVGQVPSTELPASLRLNTTLPLRVPRRVYSFPVSVTS